MDIDLDLDLHQDLDQDLDLDLGADLELDNIAFYSAKRINMVGFKNLRLSQICIR